MPFGGLFQPTFEVVADDLEGRILVNYQIFSKYRTELMAFSIIGILFCHLNSDFLRAGLSSPSYARVLALGNCGVDIFIFLSGYGLFFSFNNDSKLNHFYKKRIVKIIPKYIILGSIFWLAKDVLINKRGFSDLLLDLSFTTLFTKGTNTFWFVCGILIMYLLFPIFYKFVCSTKLFVSQDVLALILVLIITMSNICISLCFPEFYKNTELIINRFPVFVVGIWGGAKGKRKDKDYKLLFIAICSFILLKIINRIALFSFYTIEHFSLYQTSVNGLLVMIVLSCIFVFFDSKVNESKMNLFHQLTHILGNSTLEIYILHSALKNLYGFPYKLHEYFVVCVLLPLLVGVIFNLVWDKFKTSINAKHYNTM